MKRFTIISLFPLRNDREKDAKVFAVESLHLYESADSYMFLV